MHMINMLVMHDDLFLVLSFKFNLRVSSFDVPKWTQIVNQSKGDKSFIGFLGQIIILIIKTRVHTCLTKSML